MVLIDRFLNIRPDLLDETCIKYLKSFCDEIDRGKPDYWRYGTLVLGSFAIAIFSLNKEKLIKEYIEQSINKKYKKRLIRLNFLEHYINGDQLEDLIMRLLECYIGFYITKDEIVPAHPNVKNVYYMMIKDYIEKHIFPVAPNGSPFELSVWDGLGRRCEKDNDDRNYGRSPDIVDDYNILFSTILNNRGARFQQERHNIDRANKYYELAIKACPKFAQESIVNLASNLAIIKKQYTKASAMISKLLLKWPRYAGLPWSIASKISEKKGENEN